MKKLLLTILIAVLTIFVSQSQGSWQIVNPPVNENFVSVCFTDEMHGWIISETGTIISTNDAGSSWETVSFPDVHFESIHFADIDHGCTVGWQETPADSSLIMITNDGGDTWSMVDHVRVNRLNDVFFINNNIGWAVGSYTELNRNCCLYTSDGGANWYHQPSITVVGAELYGVSFRDENTGQICGYDGAFFITNNGGTSWAINLATPAPLLNLNAIFNWGVLTGCMVGEAGTALYTINNWYQFVETITNTTENLNGVSGDPSTNKLWAVGENGTIIYTSYYVLGWMEQTSGVTDHLNDVQMLSESNGWAVGDNGTILHYSIETGIEQGKESRIEIYPNPVNDLLVIELLDENKKHAVELMDCKGKYLQKESLSGYKSTTLDVSKYIPGIYFLKVSNESNSIIEKLIIQ